MGFAFSGGCPAQIKHCGQVGYGKELYKRRNEIERFFRRLKAFRAVFTRYDKLDIVFQALFFSPLSLYFYVV
jgi:transposase